MKAFSLPKLLAHRGRRAFANQILPAWETALPSVTMWGGLVLSTQCPLHRCTPGGGVFWRLLEQFVQVPPQGVSQ